MDIGDADLEQPGAEGVQHSEASPNISGMDSTASCQPPPAESRAFDAMKVDAVGESGAGDDILSGQPLSLEDPSAASETAQPATDPARAERAIPLRGDPTSWSARGTQPLSGVV